MDVLDHFASSRELTVEELLQAKSWVRGQLSELRKRERRTPVGGSAYDAVILEARVRVLDRLLALLDDYHPSLPEVEFYRGG